MSKTQYVDMDGVTNVAVGIVRQAKRDFIKGGKILYRLFGYIPTDEFPVNTFISIPDEEFMKIRQMFDAWRFVIKDPYELFESAGKENTINQWKLESIIAYYYDGYIKGAEELYFVNWNHFNTKTVLYDLEDSVVRESIKDDSIYDQFIKARNYIYSLPNGEKILDEWNATAYERARKHYKKGKKKDRTEPIRQLAKERSSAKQERIKKAKELWDLGLTREEIAEKLGVTRQSINSYLRS